MGHISGTCSFYVNIEEKYDYWWKKYGLEKTDRATKTSFWQKLGEFIETKAEKSPTSPGLVSPAYVVDLLFFQGWECTLKVLLIVGTNFRDFYQMHLTLGPWFRGFKHYRQQLMGKLYFIGF